MKKLKVLIGVYFLFSVVYSYYKIPEWLIEGTAVSNTLAGLVLISDGMLMHKGRRVPVFLYQTVVGFIMTVYSLTTFLTAFNIFDKFSFKGGFMLLHGVNPLIFLMFYLFTVRFEEKEKNNSFRKACIAPLLIMCYLLFDFIRHQITGEFVYQLLPNDSNIVLILLFGAGAYVFEVLFNFGLIKLKLYTQSKMK